MQIGLTLGLTARRGGGAGGLFRIDLLGQSEIELTNAAFYNTQAGDVPPTLVAGAAGKLRVIWWDFNTSELFNQVVDGDTTNTRHIAMANSLYATDPSREWLVAFICREGRGFEEVFSGTTEPATWAGFEEVHAAASLIKPHADILAASWYAAPRTFGASYAEFLHQLAFGKTIAGVTVTRPFDLGTTVDNTFTVGNLLSDLYDWSVSKFVVLEPHRFVFGNTSGIVDMRNAVRAMYAASTKDPALASPNHPVLHYRNGREVASVWDDETHPSPGEGSRRFAVGLIQSALRAAGVTSWTPPVIDNVLWDADGLYVEMWSSAGAISVPSGNDAVGVTINGNYVPAQIVSGRLRVTAANVGAGDPFTNTTTVDFAPISSGLTSLDDEELKWDDYPCVDLSVPGMPDGVPLANDPTIDLTSTIEGVPTFTITAASPTYFQDPNLIPSGVTSVRFEVVGSFTVGTTMALATAFLGNHEIQILGNGRLRLLYTDNGAGANLDSPFNITVTSGISYTIASVVDYSAGTVEIFRDGVSVASDTGIVGPAQMDITRRFILLSKETGQLPVTGTIQSAKVWYNDPTGAGTPHKTIAGNAATVNDDLWHEGALAT